MARARPPQDARPDHLEPRLGSERTCLHTEPLATESPMSGTRLSNCLLLCNAHRRTTRYIDVPPLNRPRSQRQSHHYPMQLSVVPAQVEIDHQNTSQKRNNDSVHLIATRFE